MGVVCISISFYLARKDLHSLLPLFSHAFTTLEKAACVVYERLTVCIFNFSMAIIQCIVMCDDADSFVAVQRIQLLLVQLVQARPRSIHLRIIQTRNLSQYVFIDLQGVH